MSNKVFKILQKCITLYQKKCREKCWLWSPDKREGGQQKVTVLFTFENVENVGWSLTVAGGQPHNSFSPAVAQSTAGICNAGVLICRIFCILVWTKAQWCDSRIIQGAVDNFEEKSSKIIINASLTLKIISSYIYDIVEVEETSQKRACLVAPPPRPKISYASFFSGNPVVPENIQSYQKNDA